MSIRPLKNPTGFYFFYLSFFLFFSPLASAQQKTVSEEHGQEASVAQAQATMASLFGRGAKMTAIPSINGTIALPMFDNSGMKVDEKGLRAAQEGKQKTED
jgi:hypothetical protein